jgi:hypothetical protein
MRAWRLAPSPLTLPGDLGAVGVGAGVTMRVPLIAAIGG